METQQHDREERQRRNTGGQDSGVKKKVVPVRKDRKQRQEGKTGQEA